MKCDDRFRAESNVLRPPFSSTARSITNLTNRKHPPQNVECFPLRSLHAKRIRLMFARMAIESLSTPTLRRLGIGITTRDRWDDIAITLSELRKGGYEDVETIVVDDGSRQPIPKTLRSEFPKVCFERVDRALGLVVQRNRLAKMLSTTYYLSLDDDSYPVAGDINQAITWLENHSSVAALALHVVQKDEAVPSLDTPGDPFPVKYYTGCAHLLRREQFLELGGYLDDLYYFCEEVDFCLKALRQGFGTFAYPGVVIRHTRTPVARNSRKSARYYMRNQVILGLLYFPFPFSILRVGGCLQILNDPKTNSHPISLLLGWLEAIVCGISWLKFRQPLSLAQFRAWKALPFPQT
jgi:GT2 family glycosyltransferase